MAKGKYDNYTKEQLIEKIKLLEKQRYGLVWEDKPEEIADQCERELPVLTEDKTKEIVKDHSKPTNFIFEGDNYHTLYTLNFTHKRKIDIIYIDPPYNTGKENEWKYNDRFVDKNDKFRHSKWLSFISKRVRLSRNLLKDDGVLFFSIGQEELANSILLLNNIFNENNQLGIVSRISKTAGDKGNHFAPSVDYILVYARNKAQVNNFVDGVNEKLYKKIETIGKRKGEKYRDDIALYQSSLDIRPNQRYFIKCPDGSFVIPPGISMPPEKKEGSKAVPIKNDGVWRWSFDDGFKNNKELIVFKKTKKSPLLDQDGNKAKWNLYTKSYLTDREEKGTKPRNIFTEFINRKGADLIKQMNIEFEYSKPVELIEYLIKITDKHKDIKVLDYFAGSGTTGQAVIELNERDNGNRQFILCTNNENQICEEVTYPRIKKVIEGYNDKKGIPANVKYFKTDYVPFVLTDNDKRTLVSKSTELLCISENTFEVVKQNKKKMDFAIFKNAKQYTAIIYDEDSIENCCEELIKINPKHRVVIYVFSYDHTYDELDFETLNFKFDVKPIPEAILNVYRKISKLKRK